jgi:hypothetical protein
VDIDNNFLEAFYTFDYGKRSSDNSELDSIIYDRLGVNHLKALNMAMTGSGSNYIAQDTIVPCPIHWYGYDDGLLTNSNNTSEGIAVPKGAAVSVIDNSLGTEDLKLTSNYFLNFFENSTNSTLDLNGYNLVMGGPLKVGGLIIGDVNSTLEFSGASYNSSFGLDPSSSGNQSLKSLKLSEIENDNISDPGVHITSNVILIDNLTATDNAVVDMDAGDTLIFKSNSSKTAMAFMGEGAEVRGIVKVESYIPGRRAFRLLSSSGKPMGQRALLRAHILPEMVKMERMEHKREMPRYSLLIIPTNHGETL